MGKFLIVQVEKEDKEAETPDLYALELSEHIVTHLKNCATTLRKACGSSVMLDRPQLLNIDFAWLHGHWMTTGDPTMGGVLSEEKPAGIFDLDLMAIVGDDMNDEYLVMRPMNDVRFHFEGIHAESGALLRTAYMPLSKVLQ
jgi:hypothetical protein